jgi:hypothetical protein
MAAQTPIFGKKYPSARRDRDKKPVSKIKQPVWRSYERLHGAEKRFSRFVKSSPPTVKPDHWGFGIAFLTSAKQIPTRCFR